MKGRWRTLILTAWLSCAGGAMAAETAGAVQARFESAIAALEAGRLRSAREQLLALLADNPGLHRARLELARVHYLDRDYSAARQQAEQVLAEPDTPVGVRTTLLAFLAQIDADARRDGERHRFGGVLQAGLMYDTNVNSGPTRDIIDTPLGPGTLLPGSREQEDLALVLNPGLTHTWNPGRRFAAGETRGFFLWQSGADLYWRAYKDEDEFNLAVLTLRTGPAWIVPGRWRATLRAQADQIWFGGDDLALFSSLSPAFTRELGERWEATLDGTLTRRDYRSTGSGDRDGTYVAGGASVTRHFRQRAAAVQGGANLLRFDADTRWLGYRGPEVWLGGFRDAWQNGTLWARAAWRHYDFDGTDPGFLRQRDDDEYRATLGFQHTYRDGALDGWVLTGSWVWTDNHSDVPIYDYDRHQVSLSLRRVF